MRVLAGIYSQLPTCTGALVLERVLSCILKPLLTFLYNHPQMRMHVHLTTAEMEWLECNHPEVNMLITDLVKKEQIELLTGGYYQPVLQLLQMKDRSAQIERTTTYIRKRYGTRAQTLWCYDQIWNPSYISAMYLCSATRLMISTFDKLHGSQLCPEPFVMQETGRTVEVFPIDDVFSETVRACSSGAINFNEARNRIGDHLRAFGEDNDYCCMMLNADQLCQGIALCGQDAEQTAIWTLLSDFSEICEQRNWRTLLLNDYDEQSGVEKYGYLPAGWYGRDSVQSNDIASFNDILVRSEELNQLYGRLLFVQDAVRNYKKNKDIRKRAESLLEKASSGVPFIAETCGGTVQPLHRKLAYKLINEAEQLLATQPDCSYPMDFDVDFDQRNEYLSLGKNISAMVDSKGGSIIELNYLPAGWNYADTFSGRPSETFDRRNSLIAGKKQKIFEDILFPSCEDLEEYSKYDQDSCVSLGAEPYDLDRLDRKGSEYQATYRWDGDVPIPFPLSIIKRYKFRQNTIIADIEIANIGDEAIRFVYGPELNLSIGTKSGVIQVFSFESKRTELLTDHDLHIKNLRNIRLFDEVNKTIVSLTCDNRFSLIKEDFYTDCSTLLGKELLYHHTILLPYFSVALTPMEHATFKFALRIERR